jgi:hypothetical protein
MTLYSYYCHMFQGAEANKKNCCYLVQGAKVSRYIVVALPKYSKAQSLAQNCCHDVQGSSQSKLLSITPGSQGNHSYFRHDVQGAKVTTAFVFMMQ